MGSERGRWRHAKRVSGVKVLSRGMEEVAEEERCGAVAIGDGELLR